MSTSRIIDLEVEVYTLRRRIGALEARIFGGVDELEGPNPLFQVYTHLQCSGVQPDEDAAALLRACTLLLTPRNLMDLGRMTGDPFPWRPFLAALDLLEVTGHDVAASSQWVQGCAEDLMRAQGLEMLRVEDVIRSPAGPLHELRRFALSKR